MNRRSVCAVVILALTGLIASTAGAEIARFECAGHVGAAVENGVLAKRVRESRVPSKGSAHVLVVFAKFRDEAPSETGAPTYAQDLFDPDLPGSFAHFYREMSCGQLQVTGTCLEKRYASLHNAGHYLSLGERLELRVGTFTREILAQTDRDVDFGQFDNDGPDEIPNSGDDDGYVDFLFLNLRSVPAGFLTGHATGLESLGMRADYETADPAAKGGTILISDAFAAIQRTDNFAHAVGSMAHEFGHGLGLLDLYDTSFTSFKYPLIAPPQEDGAGIGNWGLMGRGTLGWHGDDGPNPLCAWSREQLGWLGEDNGDVVDVTGDMRDVIIGCVWDGGKVYRIPLEYWGSVPVEYFLVEHRRTSCGYYDRHMPGSGLLIWHVTRAGDNADEMHKRVDLECADGLFDKNGASDPTSGRDDLDFWARRVDYREEHGGNLGDAGDPFDGERYTSFTLETNPASDDYAGTFRPASTGYRVESIRRRGRDMVVDFLVPRWSGRIERDVVWADTVRVVGDIVVAEKATLFLQSDTYVQIAARDATEDGESPEQCEIHVYGGLVSRGTITQPVVFSSAAEETGNADWYGIRLCSQAWTRLREEGMRVRHSQHGIFWEMQPGAEPPSGSQIHDEITGNGDGRPNPGETFEVEIWSGTRSRDVGPDITVQYDDPFIWNVGRIRWPTFHESVSRTGTSKTLIVALDQAITRFVPITLASNCPPGHEIELDVAYSYRDGGWTEPIILFVAGVDEISPVVKDLAVSSKYVPVDSEAAISVHIEEPGLLRSVMARMFNVPDSVQVGLVDLLADSTEEGRYIGVWSPSRVADFTVYVEATDARGNVGIGPEPAEFMSRPLAKTSDLLLYTEEHRRDLCERALRSRGISYDLWDYDARDFLDEETLARYGDGAVIWASSEGFRDSGSLEVLRRHVDRGGDLLLLTGNLGALPLLPASEIGAFQAEVLHSEYLGPARGSEPLVGVDGDPIAEGFRGHASPYGKLSVQRPGQTMVVDEDGYTAAIRVEGDDHRVVYFTFDLVQLSSSEAQEQLIGGAVEWLREFPTMSEEFRESSLPSVYALLQNRPNPFNTRTTIPYDLPASGVVRLSVYDLSGQRIRTLVDGARSAGSHTVTWDGTDDTGRDVASGVYLCRMETAGFRAVRKLLLIK